jgi:hypothetical protein
MPRFHRSSNITNCPRRQDGCGGPVATVMASICVLHRLRVCNASTLGPVILAQLLLSANRFRDVSAAIW